MPYATVNGIRMHYETHGAGAPVLLISGLGGPGVGWLFQVRDLSPRHHVITFDNRGATRTRSSPRSVSSMGCVVSMPAAANFRFTRS